MPKLGGDARDPSSKSSDPERNWHLIKRRILERYQFNIAFENKPHNGYVTEKLIDALVARVVPIYWGAEDVATYINPDCFIHARDFANLDDLARFVDALGRDPARYRRYLEAPIFKNDQIPDFLTKKYLARRIHELVEQALHEPPIGNPLRYKMGQTLFRIKNRIKRMHVVRK
jgi:hypothetical protein